MSVQCSDAVRQTRIYSIYVEIIPISHNISSINFYCKLIKDPSLIVERLSGAFHFQPKQFQ